MTGHPRLYRRGATYYHRAVIPIDIKDTYPKTEETFSLNTKDRAEAVRLIRIEAAKVDRKFEEHRRSLTRPKQTPIRELSTTQVKEVGEVYYAYLLEEDEETRLEGFYEPDGPLPPNPVKSFEEFVEDNDAFDDDNRYANARGKIDPFYIGEAEEVLTWTNVDIRLTPDSPSWKELARELQRASIKAADAIRLRNQGDVVETPVTPDSSVQSSIPLLSVAVEDWASEKARSSWVKKTEDEHRTWMAHFISISGDKPLTDYGKIDGRAFKQVLLHLPANWVKHAAIKDLSIREAAERAKATGLPPMSESNLNKLIGFVSAFWNWADANYDEVPANPLRGLKVKKSKQEKEERDPFTTKELKVIFTAPIYTGCESVRHWRNPGDLLPKSSGIYWVPLISLFSGARLGEIIQLYTDDIREEDGVRYFDINKTGEDKRLKNSNSRRQIPVHPALIDMGLMAHVDARRKQKEKRLFPDLPMGADGYYSSPFSKHFNRFLTSVGVKRGTIAFHSFRHSFEDACRDSDISKEIMDALQGHGEEGMSKRYGRGYVLKKRNEAMKKLKYRDLDLSHLLHENPNFDQDL